MLSGCQPGITKAAGILKRKVNTTNRQKRQINKQTKQIKKKNRNRMYTYLGKWIMVNNSKCECPFLPAHPWNSTPLQVTISGSLLGCLPWASPGLRQRALPAGPAQWTGFAWALPSRDHVSPPGVAACPQWVQTSQYRPVVATGWLWVSCCALTGFSRCSVESTAISSLAAAHCQPKIASNGSLQALGSCGSGKTTKYFVLRWQSGMSLPFSNSLASFCQNQPTSLKVDVEKNHHATLSKLPHLMLALYRT